MTDTTASTPLIPTEPLDARASDPKAMGWMVGLAAAAATSWSASPTAASTRSRRRAGPTRTCASWCRRRVSRGSEPVCGAAARASAPISTR